MTMNNTFKQMRAFVTGDSQANFGVSGQSLNILASSTTDARWFAVSANPNPITGTEGSDTLYGSSGRDKITGLGGNDTLYGLDGDDRLDGGSGNDRLYGGNGQDNLIGGTGIDTLDGGPGIDTVRYEFSKAAVNANLMNGKAWSADPNSDTYSETRGGNIALKNIEYIYGSNYNDYFNGDNGENIINGGAGDDTIYGQGARDVLVGSSGNDKLYGGDGNDELAGGLGVDTLDGGPGWDTVIYRDSKAGVNANLTKGTAWSADPNSDTYSETRGGNIALKSIELISGSNYNDYFIGSAGYNMIFGGDGNDTLYGMGGNDTLIGGLGADRIEGGVGGDTLDAGIDRNHDVFVFRSISDSGLSGSAQDRISHFRSGEDDIDLHFMDANTRVSGDQAFSFSTTGAKANAVWVTDTGNDLVVYGDTNGDARADFSIAVMNIDKLLASDFIL